MGKAVKLIGAAVILLFGGGAAAVLFGRQCAANL